MAWAAPGAMPISEKIDENDGSSRLVDERTPPAFVSLMEDTVQRPRLDFHRSPSLPMSKSHRVLFLLELLSNYSSG